MLKHIFSCESFVWNSCSKCQNDQLSMKNHVKRSFKDWKYYLHSKNDYHHIILSATFYWLINNFCSFFCCQKRIYLLFYDLANFAHFNKDSLVKTNQQVNHKNLEKLSFISAYIPIFWHVVNRVVSTSGLDTICLKMKLVRYWFICLHCTLYNLNNGFPVGQGRIYRINEEETN